MNAIRAIVHSTFRGYRTNRSGSSGYRPDGPKWRSTNMVQDYMAVENPNAHEEDDGDDLDAAESNFSRVGQSERMHRSEMAMEASKLRGHIIRRKYFSRKEPTMLTWGEKEQIRMLHKDDPVEWSIENLSDSFPASYDAIKKIIKARGWPKSTDVIERYEKKVIENWKLFKNGKLKVDPSLKEHLEKFRNRQIKIADTEDMKKYLKEKPFFPPPKSNKFTNLIAGYIEEKRARERVEMADKMADKIKEDRSMEKEITTIDDNSEIDRKIPPLIHGKSNESVTLNQFLKQHVDQLENENLTPVDRVIVDEYKERKSETYQTDTLVITSHSPVKISPTTEKAIEMRREGEENSIVPKDQRKYQPKEETRIVDENKLETGIIARQKRDDGISDDYPDYIVIPKNKFKPGVTYRVEDRYYDDDGEFLYRVTGLKS